MKKDLKEKTEVNEKNEYKHTYKDSLRELVPYIFIIFTVVLIRTFIVTPIKVNGTSMINTLQHGDTMVLNKIAMKVKDIERFQIVVIKTDDSYLIKRVIGLPGETLKYEVKENEDGKITATLYVNGKAIKEDFIDEETKELTCKNETELCNDGIKIPSDHYFVMGDNRGNSIDSRIIGVIDRKNIMGTTKLVIFPISDMGIKE